MAAAPWASHRSRLATPTPPPPRHTRRPGPGASRTPSHAAAPALRVGHLAGHLAGQGRAPPHRSPAGVDLALRKKEVFPSQIWSKKNRDLIAFSTKFLFTDQSLLAEKTPVSRRRYLSNRKSEHGETFSHALALFCTSTWNNNIQLLQTFKFEFI